MDNDITNKKNKRVIGVIPLYDDEKDSIWMLPGYMEGIQAAGGIPIILPFAEEKEDIEQISGSIDGLLLTGGHDVDPVLYNEKRSDLCGKPNRARDALEYALLSEMMRLDKPVLGICRGIQLLNVYLGGSLYQDIPAQLGNAVQHDKSTSAKIPAHSVRVAEHTPLFNIVCKQMITVNSYHHQGIRKLAEALAPMAWAEDGLVEAVYMPDKRYVAAVQWHPELSFKHEEDQFALFKTFIDACSM